MALFPLWRKACWGFFRPEKFDGFGRVWTHKLWSVRRGVIVKLQHGACPVLLSEPVGMSHNQFPPPQQCCEWFNKDPDGQALEFVQQFQELCGLWVSLCVCRQLMCDRSWTGHAIETPVYDSGFGPKRLLNHSEGLRSTFPKIGTKFDAHSFLSLIHRENRQRSRTWFQINACENCPRPPSYVKRNTPTH
jgi:hypothetical protein